MAGGPAGVAAEPRARECGAAGAPSPAGGEAPDAPPPPHAGRTPPTPWPHHRPRIRLAPPPPVPHRHEPSPYAS